MESRTQEIKLARKAVMDLRQSVLNEVDAILARLDRIEPQAGGNRSQNLRPRSKEYYKARWKAREEGRGRETR